MLIIHFFIFPQSAQAVLPPDFIFNIGTQITQFFSIIILFLTAIFGAFFQFFQMQFYAIKHKKIILLSSIFLIITISLTSSFLYAKYKQKEEYQKWLEESKKYEISKNFLFNSNNDDTNDSKKINDETNITNSDDNDQLNTGIDSNKSVDTSTENKNISVNDNMISQEYDFFTNNENKNILITNQEFKNITESEKNDYVVLDARENIEYENGYFPESLHIRFADLKEERWIELPKDKFVYVICWSGMRGKEVVDFLRTKKIIASYLEKGANGWVEFGGKWIGNIKFVKKYTDSRYQVVFNTDEVKNKVENGVILIDTREPYKFDQSHITGSINIPIMYTPTIDIENTFNQVPPKSTIITVCDGYVNCFDAKITGVELERRGHQFLGRYNKPWEYEK